jgi:hypothetical protein
VASPVSSYLDTLFATSRVVSIASFDRFIIRGLPETVAPSPLRTLYILCAAVAHPLFLLQSIQFVGVDAQQGIVSTVVAGNIVRIVGNYLNFFLNSRRILTISALTIRSS